MSGEMSRRAAGSVAADAQSTVNMGQPLLLRGGCPPEVQGLGEASAPFESSAASNPRKRKLRPALRRQLRPSDLGGAEASASPDPDTIARIAEGLGPVANRPSPIRDKILAFLATPRSASAIAAHIQRPVPTATGHLAAMRRRGLVRRIGWATYALATYDGEAHTLGPRRSRSDWSLRQSLRVLLVRRRTLLQLEVMTARPAAELLAALRDMWFSGCVTGDRVNGYQLVATRRRE